MPKTKELSLETRSEIVTKFKSGISASELVKIYKISRKTVYNLVKKKETNNCLENLSRSGRKSVMNQTECRTLINAVIQNPTISPVKIAAAADQLIGKKVSDTTLRRRLKEVKNYYKSSSIHTDNVNQQLTPITSKLPLTQKGEAQILQQKDALRPERTLWYTSEVMEMLDIIKSSNALQMLNSKTIKKEIVFKQIEQIMRRNGFKNKSHIQIWTKWKFLRSTYTKSKLNDTIPRSIAPIIYDLLHEILSSSNAHEETINQILTMHPSYNNDAIGDEEDELDPDYSSDDIRARRNLTTTNIEGNSMDVIDETILRSTTSFNTDDNMSMAHPIFGFRLNNVKEEPADNGYETSTITDQISLVAEANNTSRDNCNEMASMPFTAEIKDEFHEFEIKEEFIAND